MFLSFNKYNENKNVGINRAANVNFGAANKHDHFSDDVFPHLATYTTGRAFECC